MSEAAQRSVSRRLGDPGALAFAVLYGLESMTFALLATVVPLQALHLFGNPRDVSFLYAGIGVWGIVSAVLVPLLIRRLRPRATYTLGGALAVLGVGLLGTVTQAGQVAGMMTRVFGASCLRVPLSLFTLGYIRRRDLTRSEPLKLFLGAVPWTVGPFLGVYLYETVAPSAAFGLSAAVALALTLYCRRLRLDDRRVAQAPARPLAGAAAVRRFMRQPRLRLAWLIAFGRNAWWGMFFIYVPIYMATVGEGELAAALAVSAGNAMQLATPAMGWLGRRYTIRRVLGGAFLSCGALTVLAGLLAHRPVAAAALLVAAALAAAALDALGDIPFLRAVHPYERPEMAGVFSTYGQVAALVPPAVFAAILSAFDLPAVFLVGGLSLLGFAALTRFLPRRM